MPKILKYWLPPLVWMSIIFYFSSFPKVSVTGNTFYAFVIFKALHIIEYAVLYVLLFRAFYSISEKKLALKYQFLLAFLVGVLYAISDEVHQTFIPTREGKLRDALIDTGGIVLMYIYIRSNLEGLKKYLI